MKKIAKMSRKAIYLRDQRNHKIYINNLLNEVDFTVVKNKRPKEIKVITFVIPGLPAFSGGHTSILRLGTELSNKGYIVNYASFAYQSVEEMTNNAKINLSGYKGNIYNSELENIKSDVVIATSWESVYYSRKMAGYKMYFIQDYEPYFNLYGECYIMAEKSYEVGYHMVSLGNWNKYMIEKECKINSKIDSITFPYEGGEYYEKGRNFAEYPSKKEFNIAAYLKDTGKRAPYITQYLLNRLKNELSVDGITLNVKYYGEDKSFKCEGGENLGKLSKAQLLELYNNSDFGFVASLTNVSLVPYEMLATGLPIIEFEEGTFKHFFEDGCGILTSFDYNDLYKNFKHYIKSPNELQSMHDKSLEYLKTLSWKKTGEEFKAILDGIILKEEVERV